MLSTLFNHSQNYIKKHKKVLNSILELEGSMAKLSDSELQAKTDEFKNRYNNGESLDSLLVEAYAVLREASWRVLHMKHFPVQLLGGIILHQGNIAEMKTGEGKTLVITLPAYLNALSGKGVHVITVNEYLAKRDMEQMGQIYNFLGLTVGFTHSHQSSSEKRSAYECDITYGTNSEFAFDYLRDHIILSDMNKVQRDLNFAIIDEVDSILIDEARTPLIISRPTSKDPAMYIKANEFIKTISEEDYKLEEKDQAVTFTDSGIKKAEEYYGIENLGDMENMEINYHVHVALKATFIARKDIDYIIENGNVILIDHFTGRLAIGKVYNGGLHQGIQAKEGLEISPENVTDATITYQNYFRMYNKISGMTGTGMTEIDEFRELYCLDVIEVPTNKPVQRIDAPDVVYKTKKGKYNAVVKDITERYAKGQPVLVGTVDVEKSEIISNLLHRKGIPHQVLNAKFHEKEANIISQAGRYRMVTIATNMAGRGTDILLGGSAKVLAENDFLKEFGFKLTDVPEGADPEFKDHLSKIYEAILNKYEQITAVEKQKVLAAGGLYVIGTERYEARRIDNQLRGRSGRQGDPGESRFYLSLEDDLMRLFGGEKVQSLADKLKLDENTPISSQMLSNIVENSQKRMEGMNYDQRKQLIKFDDITNIQRKMIYKDRTTVVTASLEDMKGYIERFVDSEINSLIEGSKSSDENSTINFEELRKGSLELFGLDIPFEEKLDSFTDDSIKELIKEETDDRLLEVYRLFDADDKLLSFLQETILSIVDECWKDHIDNTAELRKNMGMRNMSNIDPYMQYHIETNKMYEEMIEYINYTSVQKIFHYEEKAEDEDPDDIVLKKIS